MLNEMIELMARERQKEIKARFYAIPEQERKARERQRKIKMTIFCYAPHCASNTNTGHEQEQEQQALHYNNT